MRINSRDVFWKFYSLYSTLLTLPSSAVGKTENLHKLQINQCCPTLKYRQMFSTFPFSCRPNRPVYKTTEKHKLGKQETQMIHSTVTIDTMQHACTWTTNSNIGWQADADVTTNVHTHECFVTLSLVINMSNIKQLKEVLFFYNLHLISGKNMVIYSARWLWRHSQLVRQYLDQFRVYMSI